MFELYLFGLGRCR